MEPVAVLACWIVVVAIVRAFFGFWVAALLSVAAATVLVGLPAYQVQHDPGPDLVEILPIVLLFGCVCGLVVPLGVEAVCYAVRWVDALIGKRVEGKKRKDEDAE